MAGGNPVTRLGTDWWTGMIDSVDMFDAGFFGIPPRVAKVMDPQHRMLLEVAHDAISDAGLTVGSLEGTATGVFVAQHRCDRLGVEVRWIDIEIAGHSPQMEGPASALRVALAGLRPLRGELPMYSSVVGGLVEGSALDGEYWVQPLPTGPLRRGHGRRAR